MDNTLVVQSLDGINQVVDVLRIKLKERCPLVSFSNRTNGDGIHGQIRIILNSLILLLFWMIMKPTNQSRERWMCHFFHESNILCKHTRELALAHFDGDL